MSVSVILHFRFPALAMNAHVFLSASLVALLLCSVCQSLPHGDALSHHAHARPAVRRRLDALPGFNVGTQPEGMDVARNGVVTVWQKWDPQQTWAQAGVASNTFYAWYLPRDDLLFSGRNVTFTIEAARVANGAGSPNEANCSVVTTPAVGAPLVAGNFTTTFSAAYTCNSTGQVEIELTLAITGYSSIGITYVKTHGNALDVGLTPTSAEVISKGITTSAFSMAKPVYVVPYEEQGSTMYLRIAPGQIPFTKHELRTSDFTLTTIPDHVVDVDLSGPASTATQIDYSSLELQVNYTCKTDKQLASTVIQVRAEWNGRCGCCHSDAKKKYKKKKKMSRISCWVLVPGAAFADSVRSHACMFLWRCSWNGRWSRFLLSRSLGLRTAQKSSASTSRRMQGRTPLPTLSWWMVLCAKTGRTCTTFLRS